MQRPDDTSALMRAAIGGNADAYREALQRFAAQLRPYIRRQYARMGRSGDDVEDIVQETLLAIHLKKHTWDQSQPIDPWVYAIARHKLIDHLRRKGFRDQVDIDDLANVLSSHEPRPDGAQAECRELLDTLPDKHRAIVEGISLQGCSAREIGEKLGMSEGAVRTALHRALKAMASAGKRSEA